jgi:hypothetical protein
MRGKSMTETCLDETGHKIVREIYRAVSYFTPDSGLLSCIGSWGDTMEDAEVLEMLKSWNEMGEPFLPEISRGVGDRMPPDVLRANKVDPRVQNLLQTVADAVANAEGKGLDANLALGLVVTVVGEYGRKAFGDSYLDRLCATIRSLRG